MGEDAFKAFFGNELMWTATLSNGTVVHLKSGHEDDGGSSHVQFADRLNYISLVKQARMSESQQQVSCFILLSQLLFNQLIFCGCHQLGCIHIDTGTSICLSTRYSYKVMLIQVECSQSLVQAQTLVKQSPLRIW